MKSEFKYRFILIILILALAIMIGLILWRWRSGMVMGNMVNQQIRVEWLGQTHTLPLAGISSQKSTTLGLPQTSIELSKFWQFFNIVAGTATTARTLNGFIMGCEDAQWDLRMFDAELSNQIQQSAASSSIINLTALVVNKQPELSQLLQGCGKYDQESALIQTQLNNWSEQAGVIDQYFAISSNTQEWEIVDTPKLTQLLEAYRVKIKKAPVDGTWENHDGVIYLWTNYTTGKDLDIQASLNNISNWLDDVTQAVNLVETQILPVTIARAKQVLDFTQLLGEGNTRMSVYLPNGSRNWNTDFAVYGLDAMQSKVVMPGKEFSYLAAVNPDKRTRLSNGQPIGNGICNATTTLFRAALEGGFKITQRSSHGMLVDSYAWGYPYNYVDAAYYTDPAVDFRFVNDTEYPVILRASGYRDAEEKYQFHTVRIYGDARATKREVELTNWKQWNKRTDKIFEAAFTRIIKSNGVEVKRDEFTSKYR